MAGWGTSRRVREGAESRHPSRSAVKRDTQTVPPVERQGTLSLDGHADVDWGMPCIPRMRWRRR